MAYFNNENLKSRAQDILKEFEQGGATWEGVALALARQELKVQALQQGFGDGMSIDLGTWDGSYCASEKDITHYDPKCCNHDFESACACCIAECDNCQEDVQNIQLI